MIDAQLLAELARSCRLLSCHQQNQNVLDMLHDIEKDFIQKARDIEGGKRYTDREKPRQDDERPRGSLTPRSS